MISITHKSSSLRKATAAAILTVSKKETIEAIQNKQVPKGDPFEFSRAAGLLAIKKTSDTIPDCHPLPVEFASIQHQIDGLDIIIHVEVHTIYRTGVEVEAMHGAAITALTMYDMLKPLDKGIEIRNIRLVEKKGGKSDAAKQDAGHLKAAVIVCSDGVSHGARADLSGKTIVQKLKDHQINNVHHEIIPDDFAMIQAKAKQFVDDKFDLLIFTGGTGLSPRDVTPDAIAGLLDRDIPGIMEAARNFGQARTPYAMLSRGLAGFIKSTLVITMPGSPKGAEETMDALFPHILHVFSIAKGAGHEMPK